MRRKGFTVIEGLIVVAIVAIILTLVLTPVKTSTPSYRAYEGWTHVTDLPWGSSLYMKRVPERHITVYWNQHNGTVQVVNDHD